MITGDAEERRHIAEGGHWETSSMVLRFKFSGVDCSRAGFGSLWVNPEKAGRFRPGYNSRRDGWPSLCLASL